MAEGINNLEAVIARLEQATADAQEATREAHSATKAVRQAERDIRATMAELNKAAGVAVEERMGEAIAAGLEEYKDTIKQVTKEAHDHVSDVMFKLANLCMYGNEQGRGPNIFDELRATADQWKKQMGIVDDLPTLRPRVTPPRKGGVHPPPPPPWGMTPGV